MIQLFYYDHNRKVYRETTYRSEDFTFGLSAAGAFDADLDWALAYVLDFGDMIVLYPENMKG